MDNIRVESIASAIAVTMSHDVSIYKALNTMRHYAIGSIVIVDANSHPVGIFTERDALRSVSQEQWETTTLGEVMSKGVLSALGSLYLHDAYAMMEQHGYHRLVIVDEDGKYIGVVSEGDFLRHLGFDHLTTMARVEDAMSDAPLCVGVDLSLSEVVTMMRSQRKEYVVVLEAGKPIRVIAEREVITHCLASGEDHYALVGDLDPLPPKLISPATPLHEAAVMMKQHGVHQLVVVNEEDIMVGILDRHDILKALQGAYYKFLIRIIDQKSDALEQIKIKEAEIIVQKQQLEEKHAFLFGLIQTIPDLIWIKSLDGKYLACNPMFERFYNAKEADILGKTDFDFVDGQLAQFFRDNDQKAFEAGCSHHNEEYLVFGDGSYEGYFDTIKTPLKNSGGDVVGILGVARDISKIKEKEKEIDKVQALAHIGTWEWDIKTDRFGGSSETRRIFGFGTDIDYVYGDEIVSRILEEDREWYKATLAQEVKEKIIREIVFRISSVQGKIQWIRSSGEFVKNSNDEPVKAIGILQDITQQKLHEQNLEMLANYDSLTGLANRGMMLSYLQSAIDRSRRQKSKIALLMFDLDRFKDVNDSFGHAIGDELLQVVAQRFSQRLREGDFIARLGGDEFAVIIGELSHDEDAGILAGEIIEVVGAPYGLSNGINVHVGVSAGISLFPAHGQNAASLLQYADAALYVSKSEGRGVYRYYTDILTDAARYRIECVLHLKQAIGNKEFELYYQPQVHIATGKTVGAEALIRWNHPTRGMVFPDEFIPIAEESGLISSIGEWVLQEACRQGKVWMDRGYKLTIAVNLSPHQIRHQNIPKIVNEALKITGFKPNLLELELTESALMQREEETLVMLHTLRAYGIRLAIDDFGTGYSSFSYLKKFPIDILKIDKSFVDDIPIEPDDMAITSAIITMGLALGFQVLAEGAETIEQVEFLREKGCTLYQGYYKSKPIPVAQFEALLLH